MSKHTPGPWAVVQGHYPSIKKISGPSFGINAVMWATDLTEDDYQKRDADLRLIAAAPNLLEALQAIVKSLADQDDEGLIEHAKQMIDARAAIAKATGEDK